MPLDRGSILHNRYRIEDQLGKGGMGAVYLAYDQTLQIRVALKENLNLNPESERQFHREATLLAGLRHPNLPRVIDHFILESRQYLVMDYIEGEDLHSLSEREPPIVGDVVDWAKEVCEALHYLHTRTPPIIHRDIKPANLKLQPDGAVILVDFGIAKVYDQSQTTTGARGLTPGYSPPEQYGSARTDARSDQYALAATMYSLLTGQAPVDSIERMLKKADLRPPKSLNPAIPDHVDAALMRALELDQDDRFESVAGFKEALEGSVPAATIRAGDPMPVTVRADTAVVPPSAPRKEGRRFPVLPVIGILVGAVVLLGGGAALAAYSGILNGGGDEPSPTQSLPLAVADPSETQAPGISPTPVPPSSTVSPSDTPQPTLTPSNPPSPSPAPELLGGGGRIAFSSDRGEGFQLQIWTMNPDGSEPRQLTFGPGDKVNPAWSPDGRRLLYSAPGGEDQFGNDLGMDIYVINVDGSGIQNLTQSQGDDTEPDWSPDGSRIIFTSDRINNLRQIFIVDIACEEPPTSCQFQNEPFNFSQGYAVEYSASWSPDGSSIAVTTSINNARGRIFIRSAGGGEPSRLDRSDTIIGADHLDWSPDGQVIAFTWLQPTLNEIYFVPVDDPGRREKLTNSAGNKFPEFSPDGNWIVFTSTRDQNPEIYLMSSTGANETNLSQSPGSQDQDPAWQPVAVLP